MEGRWFKYKNSVMNLNRVTGFHARKVEKDMVAYCDVGVSKTKKWILSADHQALEACASKEDALKLAESIIAGRYDIKK